MKLRDGLRLFSQAGRLAVDVAMLQPGIRRRVLRVKETVDDLRRELDSQVAQAEARARVFVNEVEDEARRLHRQSQRRLTATDHDRVLELSPAATLDDVKRAYRRLMREHHPDKHANDAEAEGRAHTRSLEINRAYAELSALLTGREGRVANEPRRQ